MHLFHTLKKKRLMSILSALKENSKKKNMIAKSGAETSLIESHIGNTFEIIKIHI